MADNRELFADDVEIYGSKMKIYEKRTLYYREYMTSKNKPLSVCGETLKRLCKLKGSDIISLYDRDSKTLDVYIVSDSKVHYRLLNRAQEIYSEIKKLSFSTAFDIKEYNLMFVNSTFSHELNMEEIIQGVVSRTFFLSVVIEKLRERYKNIVSEIVKGICDPDKASLDLDIVDGRVYLTISHSSNIFDMEELFSRMWVQTEDDCMDVRLRIV